MYASVFFFITDGEGTLLYIPLVAASRTDPLPLFFMPFLHGFGRDHPASIACWILAGVAAVTLIPLPRLLPVVELPASLRQATLSALHWFDLRLALTLAAVPI